MKRRVIGTLLLAVAIAILGAGLYSVSIQEVWVGGFMQVEYEVAFRDETDQPIEGVELRVIDAQDRIAYGYPVTDYLDRSIPTSNSAGVMRFHHVSLGSEFGGCCRRLFWVYPIGNCEAPRYTIQFLLFDKEIARYPYTSNLGTLADYSALPTIKRESKDLGPSPPSLPDHLRTENRPLPVTIEYYQITKTIVIKNGNQRAVTP